MWHDDIPYTNRKHNNFLNRIVGEEISELELSYNLVSNETYASTKNLLRALNYVENTEIIPEKLVLNKFANSEEVLIRIKTAFYYFKNLHRFEADDYVEDLLKDEHPAVIFSAIKGAFFGFPSYPKEVKEIVFPILIESFKNRWVVVKGNNLITTFGIDYGSESINWQNISTSDKFEIWDLWSYLLPCFLGNHPISLRIPNSGRFGVTLNQAANFLSPKASLRVSLSLFNWVEKSIKYRHLDDYQLSIMKYLIKSTKDDTTIRFSLFKKLLDVSDTSFAATSILCAIGGWEELTIIEKEYIGSFLQKERSDISWLRAIAVTGYYTPQEVIQSVFQDPKYLSYEHEKIITSCDPEFLLKCIQFYCGEPKEITYFAFNHRGELWLELVKCTLKINSKIGFDICLRELLNQGLNGFDERWHDGHEIWGSVCALHEDKELLANELLSMTIQCTCNIQDGKKLWGTIIKQLYDQNRIEILTNCVLNNIKELQIGRQAKEDFSNFLNQSNFLMNEIISKLDGHKELLYCLVELSKNPEKANSSHELIISNANKKVDIKIEMIYDFAEGLLSEKKLPPDISNQLEKLYSKKEEPDFSYRAEKSKYELIDWNGLKKLEIDV